MSGPILLPRQRVKPLLVYDGDCGFCLKWIGRWRHATGTAVEYAPLQSTSAEYPEIPRESFEREVKLITTDGRVYGGAQAVFRSLNLGDRPGRIVRLALWAYEQVPGFALVTETCYRFVAKQRSFISAITRWM